MQKPCEHSKPFVLALRNRAHNLSSQPGHQQKLPCSLIFVVDSQTHFMSNSREEARFTVRDGAVSLYLDDVSVHIPSHLWRESELFKEMVLSVSDSPGPHDFALVAPGAWLQAWVDCYAKKKHALADASIRTLVNCLMVWYCYRNITYVGLTIASWSGHVFTAFKAGRGLF
jgi:hypothetical protein